MQRTEEIKNKEYKEVVFVAEDGTRFVAHNCGQYYNPTDDVVKNAEEQCKKYEQSCEGIVSQMFLAKCAKRIGKDIEYYLDYIFDGGNGNADYYLVQPKSLEDIELLLKYMRLIGESSPKETTVFRDFSVGLDQVEIGKTYILAYWVESPWMSLYETERIKQYVSDAIWSAVKGTSVGMFLQEGRDEE